MPLALFAAANTILGVIQQGCEMYTEYKGTVVKAKKTFDQVQQNVNEVKSVWKFIKEKIFRKKKDPPIISITAKAAEITAEEEPLKPSELDESSIYFSIAKNITKLYRIIEALQDKLAEAEEKSKDLSNATSAFEHGMNRVLIHKEIIRLSAELKTMMCWNTPVELGALYSEVTEMRMKVIDERNARRKEEEKKRKEKQWQQEQLINQIKLEVFVALITLLFLLEVIGLWTILKTHQQ